MNWILILFAGFFFLLLFVSIINSVTRTATTTDEVVLVSRITNTIEQTRAAPGTSYTVELRNLEASCTDTFNLEFSNRIEQLRGHPIFSQRNLDGTTVLFSEQLRINKPYTTMTYLYTKDTTLYISEALNPALRAFLNNRFDDVRTFSSAPNSFSGRKTIVLFDGDTSALPIPQPSRNQDLRIFNITSNQEQGLITLPEGATIAYPSQEFFLGAIISDDEASYACALRLAEQRIKFTAKILEERARIINESINRCNEQYTLAINEFQDLRNNLDLSEQNALISHRTNLRNINTRLAANNCPQV